MIEVLSCAHIDEIMILEAEGFPLAERWSLESWNAEFVAENLVLGYRDETLLGVACFALAGDVADLRSVTVHTSIRRRGVAKELVMGGIEWATQLGVARMMLEVDTTNDSALALYSQLGFTGIAIREDYYGEGKDALVMELPLPMTATQELLLESYR